MASLNRLAVVLCYCSAARICCMAACPYRTSLAATPRFFIRPQPDASLFLRVILNDPSEVASRSFHCLRQFRHFVYLPQKPMCPQLAVFDILGDLYFGAVGHIENALHQHRLQHPTQRFLLLRMHSVQVCDISGIHMLEGVVRAYRERHGDVYLVRVQEPIVHLMRRTGVLKYLGRDHILSEDTAIEHLFYKVLDPAICIYESNVRVFKECQNLPRPDYPITLSLDLDLSPSMVTELTPDQLWQQLREPQPPLVIDMREPREFQRGHIPRAELLPLATLFTSLPRLPGTGLNVFVCRGGRRSERAARLLQQKGYYANVAVLKGGMLAWEAAGLLEATT